jgi:hypothetical protein
MWVKRSYFDFVVRAEIGVRRLAQTVNLSTIHHHPYTTIVHTKFPFALHTLHR